MLVWALCAGLGLAAAALAVRLVLLRRDTAAVCRALGARLAQESGAPITTGSGDRHVRRLVAALNTQLALLEGQRRRYLEGDLALEEAVTGVTHDLRTPLTAIRGYLDLLEGAELPADAERYLGFIRGRVEAMGLLTEELFRYSVARSAGEPHLEPVCLNGALEESVAGFYAALKGRGIEPVIRMPRERVVRRLDRAALARVFNNLLSNALRYSGGDLEIVLEEDGSLCFSNSAPGLDEVQVGRLFDRFFTVEDARESAGLGLAIARTLVERMGGGIGAGYRAGRLVIRLTFPPEAMRPPRA